MRAALSWAPIHEPDRAVMLDVLAELVQAGLAASERPEPVTGSSERAAQDLAEPGEVAA